MLTKGLFPAHFFFPFESLSIPFSVPLSPRSKSVSKLTSKSFPLFRAFLCYWIPWILLCYISISINVIISMKIVASSASVVADSATGCWIVVPSSNSAHGLLDTVSSSSVTDTDHISKFSCLAPWISEYTSLLLLSSLHGSSLRYWLVLIDQCQWGLVHFFLGLKSSSEYLPTLSLFFQRDSFLTLSRCTALLNSSASYLPLSGRLQNPWDLSQVSPKATSLRLAGIHQSCNEAD